MAIFSFLFKFPNYFIFATDKIFYIISYPQVLNYIYKCKKVAVLALFHLHILWNKPSKIKIIISYKFCNKLQWPLALSKQR